MILELIAAGHERQVDPTANLIVGVISPADPVAFAPHPAGVALAGDDLDEGPARRRRLAVAVVSPARRVGSPEPTASPAPVAVLIPTITATLRTGLPQTLT